jgi:hypothetical protein
VHPQIDADADAESGAKLRIKIQIENQHLTHGGNIRSCGCRLTRDGGDLIDLIEELGSVGNVLLCWPTTASVA